LDVDVLNEAESQRVEQGETIRIDSAGLNSAELNDEMTKIISREPPAQAIPSFDPYRTVVSDSSSTSSAPPAPPTPPAAPPAAAPPTAPPATPPAAPPTSPPPENADLMRTMASVPPPPVHSASPPPPIPPPVAEPPAAQPQPQPPPMHAAAPRPKRSKVPLVLGILAVLFIFAIVAAGAGYWFVVRPMLAKRAALVNEPERRTETPTPRSTPGGATPTPREVAEVP